jgi:hypothetical protein
MPEVPICVHCRQPVDQEKDDYVITNKDKVKYDNQWLYAHAECQSEKG